MIVSGGELVLSDTSPAFHRQQYFTPGGFGLIGAFATYAQCYRRNIWVYSAVNKLARSGARLPLRVYDRVSDDERRTAFDTPYATLLRNPNPKHAAFFLWLWTMSTVELYGEAMWAKVRGRRGQVVELWPLHPANVYTRLEEGELFYYFGAGTSTAPQLRIPAADIVHFKGYNPDSTVRGMSPLEPLRETVVNEDAARRATTSFWRRGARPGMVLSHPKTMSDGAMKRLKANWDEIHGGTDNTGGTAILEEGMKPERIMLSAEEAQYIETRKLNREEVCGAYDIPPPALHILDHATYSNITEQLRSIFRDVMPPRLQCYETTLDLELRADFGADGLYQEFDLAEVLRGDPEREAEADQKAVNSGILMPSEARRRRNLPFVPGSDRLFVNATLIPIEDTSQHTSDVPAALDVPAVGAGEAKRLTAEVVQTVTARAAKRASLEDIDPAALVAGLNGKSALVLGLLDQAKDAGQDVPDFCATLWALARR